MKKNTEKTNCTCKSDCKCKYEKNYECECNKEDNRIKELEDKLLRMQAEFINARSRQETEISNLLKYEGESIIKEILSIVDNFERAIKMDNNDPSDEVSKFLEGFKMIYTSLISILNKNEVKEIDCLGKEFNPVYAEAVLVEQDENKPAGVVLEVLTKGYMYKERVLRPAMVKVNK